MSVPSIRPELRALILKALDADYTSESCQDAIQTGNHYQSIRLEDEVTTGFRTPRDEFLDRIPFEGKHVLDLGSNLGELSRGARARGAALVDGFEYDPFFVELANALNAYNGVTRVSFFHRDITVPSAYVEPYDIVLAFSVFTYIRDALPEIARVTRELLVVETHKLDDLERDYVRPVASLFPHYRVLGYSDWGRDFATSEMRAVVAFARDESHLTALRATGAAGTARLVEAQNGGVYASDSISDVDVQRTHRELHATFLSKFPHADLETLLEEVVERDLHLDTLIGSAEVQEEYWGWPYWFAFLKGYGEYRKNRTIGAVNFYYQYLVRCHWRKFESGWDPELLHAENARTVVARRFHDLDKFRRSTGEEGLPGTDPIVAIVGDPPPMRPLVVHLIGAKRPIAARAVDGWHRIFAAGLTGKTSLPCRVIVEEYHAMDGEVETTEWSDHAVRLSGWCVSPTSPIEWVEVRANGELVGRGSMEHRADIAERFAEIPHAAASGFSVVGQLSTDREQTALSILGMRDWLPVGVFSAIVERPPSRPSVASITLTPPHERRDGER